ncbi:helix-hairpin-helix domain-containing protein [Methylobacterium tardum]|uniref:helix-hairpin-helix domain-containing protein n=1 Tax=Methylobacterium tardum TaxID=374432 RepID=UPI0020227FF2|nr:helix-hairpin-helix domain-containing protein [Methylobacterium tardum]URD37800.1 helix-hairpin-helix domain-containing protein [Methylobacterium tardum]
MAEPPTEAQPAEPLSPPAASAEPVRAPPAPPRTAAVPAAPAQMPSDALAVPSDPAAPPEAHDAAGQAEIDRAEDTAGPRAVAVVDLNTASVADLNRLRGGGAIGRAIVAKRPYTSVDQLLSKRVLSRSVYERIRDQVTVR